MLKSTIGFLLLLALVIFLYSPRAAAQDWLVLDGVEFQLVMCGLPDTDADSYGNVCDGDFDQNLVTDGLDFAIFTQAFRSQIANLGEDMDGNGVVDGVDFGLFKTNFVRGAPGMDEPMPLIPGGDTSEP